MRVAKLIILFAESLNFKVKLGVRWVNHTKACGRAVAGLAARVATVFELTLEEGERESSAFREAGSEIELGSDEFCGFIACECTMEEDVESPNSLLSVEHLELVVDAECGAKVEKVVDESVEVVLVPDEPFEFGESHLGFENHVSRVSCTSKVLSFKAGDVLPTGGRSPSTR